MPGLTFEKCELDLNYIEPEANGLATNVHFITGVMKIQSGIEYEKKMTAREKQACRCLLRDGIVDDSDESEEDDDGDSGINFVHAFKKDNKRKRLMNPRLLVSILIADSSWAVQQSLRTFGVSKITCLQTKDAKA